MSSRAVRRSALLKGGLPPRADASLSQHNLDEHVIKPQSVQMNAGAVPMQRVLL